MNTCTCFIAGDGEWNQWTNWVEVDFYAQQNGFLYPNLTIALCKKTNHTRQRSCKESLIKGNGKTCTGNSVWLLLIRFAIINESGIKQLCFVFSFSLFVVQIKDFPMCTQYLV